MITFNGKELPEWVSVTGLTLQSTNVEVLEHEAKRRVGNFDAGINKGGINIDLDIFIEPVKGLSLFEQQDILKRFIMGDNWKVSKLVIKEQPNKYYNARYVGQGEITDNFTHGVSSMTFYASDPKKYDVTETVKSSSSGQAIVNYTGLEETPIEIEISVTKAVANPVIEHLETGKKMSLIGNFKVGQKVIIDTNSRNVKLDGTSIKSKMAFESNWLSLEYGTNTFKSTSPDGVINDFKLKYRTAD